MCIAESGIFDLESILFHLIYLSELLHALNCFYLPTLLKNEKQHLNT